ncbi:glutamine--fructose-6-phosphate transaminase (isomerizing) [Aeromicrobium phragmitis]|uniref:Glutamine--fructose-6-phosphate aminotransferase [isomerizing] n=1 Tax=Aeromicrobium phragmitis TaxID=2478914 RepID=A0A3L8PLR2_9ACTN|nr:glutamine--fructose-6-phosphate transaminase (isomerizing) [Aeromicrobium phragmitis]RLV55683.1 glutamine--fructose-6-phosphate transaminase (isomerizing) [Aeromicrobium phragmitis]
MCGIVACTGAPEVGRVLLDALSRLEYRGYDSAGIAVTGAADGRSAVLRTTFRVDDLQRRLDHWQPGLPATTGVAHTRWATHGEVSVDNAHPHTDCSGRLAVVHNGVLDNVLELRAELGRAGHVLTSQTDTELIAHLIEGRLGGFPLRRAVEETIGCLRGSWALAVLDGATGELVVTCHGSPLVVAESERGVFAASDLAAIAPWVERYRIVEDGDVLDLAPGLPWWRHGMAVRPPASIASTLRGTDLTRGVHPDFMAKEIEQQPEVVAEVMTTWGPSVAGDLWPSFGLQVPRHLTIVGCGTSLHAGRAVAQVTARLGGIPYSAIEASEVATTTTVPGSLAVVLSQSGETADVLRAVDVLHQRGHPILALTNNPHSALARQAQAVMLCQAGPEIGVAATKTFTAQVIGGTAMGLSLLAAARLVDRSAVRRRVAELSGVPDLLAYAIGAARRSVPDLVPALLDSPGFVFLGRGSSRVFADEGALKLKELTYRWAESHAAGELKHGPLALIETGTPVVVLDDGSERLAANIAEVRARGARVISVGPEQATIPARTSTTALARGLDWLGPLETVVGLQVLARELAVALGRDVDKPRNLAKSVTVE